MDKVGMSGVENIFRHIGQSRTDAVFRYTLRGLRCKARVHVWSRVRRLGSDEYQSTLFTHGVAWYGTSRRLTQMPGDTPARPGSIEAPSMVRAFNPLQCHASLRQGRLTMRTDIAKGSQTFAMTKQHYGPVVHDDAARSLP